MSVSAQRKWLAGVALLLAVSGAHPGRADDDSIACDPSGASTCKVKATNLALRLLVKPGAHMYVEKDEGSASVGGDLPPFSVLNAFSQDGVSYDANNFTAAGWFHAGHGDKSAEGWIKADDVVPWKQALAVAYTNPGPSERRPVLMFESAEALKKTLDDIKSNAVTPSALYDAVTGNNVPPGIISREGNAWVDIDKTFYLLPILQYESFDAYSPDMMSIQLAALTNQGRAQQAAACNLQQAGGDKCLQEQAGGGVKSFAADVVFVIDTTNSMQPNIDAVTAAIGKTAQIMSQKTSTPDALKFGLVGYRDNVESTPALEYVTKNFTPDLVSADKLQSLLDSGAVKASDSGSGDWEEEVFAGVRDGIKSNWSPEAAHIMILIGDASSHPVGDPKNTTGLSEVALKDLAKQSNVYIASIYVADPKAASDLALARPQFEGLAVGDQDSGLAFSVVQASGQSTEVGDAGGAAGESTTSLEEALKGALSKVVESIATGRFDSIVQANTANGDTAGQAILGAVRAAFVDYIGKSAQPPANIISWVVDRDLSAYNKKSFDIKVMLQRGEVQELQSALNAVLSKFQASQSTSATFLQGVQAGSTATSYDLKIADTEKVMNSPLVPLWIKNLPYKSEVLTISVEEFKNESADDRSKFEANLGKLIAFYDDILNRPNDWIQLDPQGTAEEAVYMLDLKNLP
ncbi:vWA domain-containing protein [Mesorhizobium sp. M1163]|uniref:vWA domain-containing protein n=1 Tax=Mesorhizobium sp. M1163 TaxID=2957065 RepID=UPI003338B6DD